VATTRQIPLPGDHGTCRTHCKGTEKAAAKALPAFATDAANGKVEASWPS